MVDYDRIYFNVDPVVVVMGLHTRDADRDAYGVGGFGDVDGVKSVRGKG